MEMELDFIKKYVITSLRQNRRQAEKLFKTKYDPFYKWTIGDLNGENLKMAFISYLNNINTLTISEYVERQFTLLKSAFIEHLLCNKLNKKYFIGENIKNIENIEKVLTNQDWIKVKEEYQKRKNDEFLKEIREKSINEIKKNANQDTLENTLLNYIKDKDEYLLSDFEIEELKDNVLNTVNLIQTGDWVLSLKENNKKGDEFILAIYDISNSNHDLTELIPPLIKVLRRYGADITLQIITYGEQNIIKGTFILA